MDRSLSADIKVNKLDLPKEWEEHAEIYRHWAEEYALSTLEKDRAKEHLDLTFADLDLAIRADPKAYDLDKISESGVKSTIKMQVEHQEAQAAFDDAKYKVSRMQAAKDAMEHRRDALKNLSKLALAGFYTANTAPPEVAQSRSKTVREAFKKQRATRQKRGIVK